MADAKPQTQSAAKELTAADAAKRVKREVPILDKQTGKPTGKTREVAVRANEVFDFRDYGDHVVVVTTDGRKLRGAK